MPTFSNDPETEKRLQEAFKDHTKAPKAAAGEADDSEPGTQLAVMQKPLQAIEVFEAENGVADILAKIKSEVDDLATHCTVETVPGRGAIRSLAYKVRRSKTALDELGKGHVIHLKRTAEKVDAKRRVIRATLDAMAEDVRKPLTAWEEQEQARLQAHQDALDQIVTGSVFDSAVTSEQIAQRNNDIAGLFFQRDWEEFAGRAAEAHELTTKALEHLHAAAVKYEAEQVELARRRQDAIDRARRDREAEIARAAAEEATRKAAAAAQKVLDDARIATQLAEQRARDAEDAQRRAAQQAIDDRAAAERAAELRIQEARDAEQAAARAKAQRLVDEQAAWDRAYAEATAENERIRARAAAHHAHQARINREALADLIANCGLTEAQAKRVIEGVARGNVSHVVINY